MERLMKCCARGALGLGAAALLLAGIPAHVKAAPDAASRESQPRLLAQTATKPGAAEQLEKTRPVEQPKKPAMDKQQQPRPVTQPRMRTRGPMPEAAPEAKPSAPGGKRFGAGVVRHGDPGETGEAE
jgi:hypothetical protein